MKKQNKKKQQQKKPFLSNNEPKSVFDLFFWLEST